MQVSYHFALTKFKNYKTKKKKKFCNGQYRPVLPEIGRYDRYIADTVGI